MAGGRSEVHVQIEQMHQTIQDATYYEILGVSRDIDSSGVNTAHRSLIKKFHIDALRRHGLTPELETQVQEINAAINAAKATLGNPEKKQNYDMELDGDSGSSVVDIFNADALFLRGRATLDRGSIQGASEMFQQAHELNPDDRDIFLYMKFTEFLLLPKKDGGVLVAEKTKGKELHQLFEDEMDSRDELPDWLLTQTGTMALGLGLSKMARSHFTRAIKANPENKSAARQLRLLEMREEKESNEGFLSKFLKKLGIGT